MRLVLRLLQLERQHFNCSSSRRLLGTFASSFSSSYMLWPAFPERDEMQHSNDDDDDVYVFSRFSSSSYFRKTSQGIQEFVNDEHFERTGGRMDRPPVRNKTTRAKQFCVPLFFVWLRSTHLCSTMMAGTGWLGCLVAGCSHASKKRYHHTRAAIRRANSRGASVERYKVLAARANDRWGLRRRCCR